MYPLYWLAKGSDGSLGEVPVSIMAFDISGAWEAGDDFRLVRALQLPFGSYTLTCLHSCCAQMEDISVDAVIEVRALLDDYDAARLVLSDVNLGDTEGKTLVEADVLKWQVNDPSQPSGPQQEIGRAHV